MEKGQNHHEEQGQTLKPEITYASLDRSIEFVFPSVDATKDGALKAMSAILLDDGIKADIEKVDLSKGRGRVGWDYYGFYALKTNLDFKQLEDARWTLNVSKVYSEGSSLRSNVEKAVGEPSLVSGASISLKLPTSDQGKAYLQSVGMDFSSELLAKCAQDKAYERLTILLRDMSTGYDRKTQSDIFDRPEDMGQVLIDFARSSNHEVQGRILTAVNKRLSETHMEDWSTLKCNYPGGSLEKALKRKDFNPIATIQEICNAMDKVVKPGLLGGRKLHPGSYSAFYLDSLRKSYSELEDQDKAKLFEILYTKCKARVEEKSIAMPTEMRFDNHDHSQGLSELSLNINSPAPVNSEYFTAKASIYVEGTFNLIDRTFGLDDYPTEFSLWVNPTPEYRYSNDRNIQALINVTASKLALQEPDYLTSKMRSAGTDNSHNWAIDTLGATLLKTDNPILQDMGLSVLKKRTNSGASHPELN